MITLLKLETEKEYKKRIKEIEQEWFKETRRIRRILKNGY